VPAVVTLGSFDLRDAGVNTPDGPSGAEECYQRPS